MDATADTTQEDSAPTQPWLGLTLGARVEPDGVRFRCWAPERSQVEVLCGEDATVYPMARDDAGYWSTVVLGANAGMRYQYRLDGREVYPDPCSRYQPTGPHGPSLIVDPSSYHWQDEGWSGVRMHGQVIYELHIGTFTPEGTFDAAAAQLAALKDLGITVVEVMPVAEFPGRRNWGYDGVGLYAPAHVYGDPEAFKRLVNTAHRLGLGVILDVVYNHLGPDGNYLPAFTPHYFTDRYPNEWGQAMNFDGPGSSGVRDFFIQNACYWVDEFHLDGLRLDAVHALHDAGTRHVLADLSHAARQAAGARSIILVAECEEQWVQTIHPIDQGGWGLDGVWSEDFHHAARVAATGRREGYYTDYRGTAQELLSCMKRSFLFQGQRYQWQRKPRGTVVGREPAAGFVFFLQNHDQVANQLRGDRLHEKTSPGLLRVLTAILLLSPQTPLLFMGQEFAASSPFFFFADFPPGELADAIHRGRKEFLAQFASVASQEAQANIPDPCDPRVFTRSQLDLSERERHRPWYELHRDLLRLRRGDPVIALQARDLLDGAVIGPEIFVVRYVGNDSDDRLLMLNLGHDYDYRPAPEPLLAPPERRTWSLLWSSDEPRYGGPGVIDPLSAEGWRVPAESAVLYRTEPEG
ncbi:MAG: malto-oligosyltrehalose trehalohydrolase [Nitrospira sp.]|nr:malto-oligosyltrehalose trehalohydrolase [Nitrospira sp.]